MTQEEQIQLLCQISRIVNRAGDPSEWLNEILKTIVGLVGLDRCCIILRDLPAGSERIFRFCRDGVTDNEFLVDPPILEHAERGDQRTFADVSPAHIREAVCLPIRYSGQLKGFLYGDVGNDRDVSSPVADGRTVSVLEAVCDQVAVGWEIEKSISRSKVEKPLVKIGEAMASLTHHIKNILQGVNGGSHILEDGITHENQDLTRQGWEIVRRNHQRLSEVIKDVLSFEVRRELSLKSVDLRTVISSVVEKIRASEGLGTVQIDWQAPKILGPATIDREQIFRVLENLVCNAVEASRGSQDGRVTLRVNEDSESQDFRISIRDNGCGILEEKVPHVFSLFESSKDGRKTGIGLAVAQKYVQQHDGEILVQSKEGQGSEFTVVLPYPEKLSAITLKFGKSDSTGEKPKN